MAPWAAVAATTAYFQGLTLAHRVLDIDEANYGAIAALMNAGGRLYADGGVDNKPPVIFWVYAAAYRFFGTYDMTAVHVFKVGVVLATAAVVALIAQRLAGRPAGWPAAVLYVAFTAAGYSKLAAANTEVFMMLPAAASFLLLLDRRWAASGALLALAAMTKQVAVLQLALYPAAALLLHAGWRPVLSGLAGFAGGLAVLVGVLALTGSAPGWWHWAVAVLLTRYGPSAWTGGQLRAAIESGLVPWLEAVPLLVVAAFVWLAARMREARVRLAAAWLLVSAVGAVAGGHFFGHYFIQVAAPLAALAGAALAGSRHARNRPLAAAVAVTLLAAPAVLFTAADYGNPGVQADPVSAYVAAHSQPADRIFVWGDSPGVYLFSGRTPATRFVGFLRGFPRGSGLPPDNWDTQPEVWAQLAADFAAHPPVLIVDTSTAGWEAFGGYPMSRFPVLPEIVGRRYQAVAVVDGVTIYRLR